MSYFELTEEIQRPKKIEKLCRDCGGSFACYSYKSKHHATCEECREKQREKNMKDFLRLENGGVITIDESFSEELNEEKWISYKNKRGQVWIKNPVSKRLLIDVIFGKVHGPGKIDIEFLNDDIFDYSKENLRIRDVVWRLSYKPKKGHSSSKHGNSSELGVIGPNCTIIRRDKLGREGRCVICSVISKHCKIDYYDRCLTVAAMMNWNAWEVEEEGMCHACRAAESKVKYD